VFESYIVMDFSRAIILFKSRGETRDMN
jgi:hypothetical protein